MGDLCASTPITLEGKEYLFESVLSKNSSAGWTLGDLIIIQSNVFLFELTTLQRQCHYPLILIFVSSVRYASVDISINRFTLFLSFVPY
jgi:hypothetical protein